MAPVTAQGAMSDDAFFMLCRTVTVEEVRKALASGANVHAKDNDGKTALMFAAGMKANPEVVKVLLENGADVHAVDNNGHDAIWWAQQRKWGDKEKIMQILNEYASSGR